MICWHYTAWARLRHIVDSGHLRPSNAGATGEQPLLWFSLNQRWEATATKLVGRAGRFYRLTFAEQAAEFGCVRFGLSAADPRLLGWKVACAAAGTPRETRRTLEVIGRRQGGDPAEWFATVSKIPLSDLAFEVWLDGWKPARADEMVEAWASTRSA